MSTKQLTLLESLIENDSIVLNQTAESWEAAIELAIAPLIKAKAVKTEYITSIIKNVEELGPYFIIDENIAMPHARPENGVLKNAFSLLTLKNPVTFPNDKRKISVFISLAAVSADIHVAVALPQVVAIFENPQTVGKILSAQNKKDIIELFKTIDTTKYIT